VGADLKMPMLISNGPGVPVIRPADFETQGDRQR
jgi:hypothetical protein